LPEVGERVLVEFLGDWDSEAVVIGVVRQHPQGTTYNPQQTKRWSTPSGNEVILHTHGGKDVFQVKTQGKMAFESQIEQGRHSLTINSGGHPDNMIHFEGGNAGARLDIHVQTDLHMQAGNNITLEAKSINLLATKQIQFTSEQGSIGTQAQVNTTEKTITGQTVETAKTDVSATAETGAITQTAPLGPATIGARAGINIQSPADVLVRGKNINFNP